MTADPAAREFAIAAEVPIAVRDHGGQGTDVLLLSGGLRTMDDWRLGVPASSPIRAPAPGPRVKPSLVARIRL